MESQWSSWYNLRYGSKHHIIVGLKNIIKNLDIHIFLDGGLQNGVWKQLSLFPSPFLPNNIDTFLLALLFTVSYLTNLFFMLSIFPGSFLALCWILKNNNFITSTTDLKQLVKAFSWLCKNTHVSKCESYQVVIRI